MLFFTDKQLREVFHFLFLERLLKTSSSGSYILKGGINFRFFFGSPQYSEDMDLDVMAGSVETLKKNGYKILEDPSFKRVLQTYGIESLTLNDPAKAKHTPTTQRFRLRLVTASGEEFPTKVEFSRRGSETKSGFSFETISPEIVRPYQRLSYSCQHYDAAHAALQKIAALGGRAETQARDAFDLYILHLRGQLDRNLIHSKTQKPARSQAMLALMSLDYDAYQGQVVEYLEPTAKARFGDKSEWKRISQIVLKVLE